MELKKNKHSIIFCVVVAAIIAVFCGTRSKKELSLGQLIRPYNMNAEILWVNEFSLFSYFTDTLHLKDHVITSKNLQTDWSEATKIKWNAEAYGLDKIEFQTAEVFTDTLTVVTQTIEQLHAYKQQAKQIGFVEEKEIGLKAVQDSDLFIKKEQKPEKYRILKFDYPNKRFYYSERKYDY